jgi:hypothetical protein
LIGVPSGVNVKNQRPETHLFLGNVRRIGAIQPAAHTDYAIKILAPALRPDTFRQRRKFCLTPGIGMPIRLNLGSEVIAVVTDPLCIKFDARIACIHDAAGAYLVRASIKGVHLFGSTYNDCYQDLNRHADPCQPVRFFRPQTQPVLVEKGQAAGMQIFRSK